MSNSRLVPESRKDSAIVPGKNGAGCLAQPGVPPKRSELVVRKAFGLRETRPYGQGKLAVRILITIDPARRTRLRTPRKESEQWPVDFGCVRNLLQSGHWWREGFAEWRGARTRCH